MVAIKSGKYDVDLWQAQLKQHPAFQEKTIIKGEDGLPDIDGCPF